MAKKNTTAAQATKGAPASKATKTPRPRARKGNAAVPNDIVMALDHAGSRTAPSGDRNFKKRYAEKLSDALAQAVADALRPDFGGILPTEDGLFKESRARTSKGVKRLDVNYSTTQLGLGLGVSIKTVNFPEEGNGNYAKNVTARDNELRAEAEDYHLRQPYAVLIALYFMPVESCGNATARKPSSFGHTAKTLRHRACRQGPHDRPTLFERVFVGLYWPDGERRGDVVFFDVALPLRYQGIPESVLTFPALIAEIKREYDSRNGPPVMWSDGGWTGSKSAAQFDGASVSESTRSAPLPSPPA